MALIHASLSPGRSREMLRIVNGLSLYLWKAATTFGFSVRQGTHQLAQKSRRTYLPLNACKETGIPAVSFWVKSKAVLPIPVRLFTRMLFANRLAGALFRAS